MTQYPADLQESPAEDPEEVESLDVLASYLHGETDCDLAYLTVGTDLKVL